MVFWDRNLIAALVFWFTFPIDLKKWVCIVGQFNHSLGGWKGNFTPCWFSLNNSETVKAATLALCNFQWHFIRDVRAKFGILYSPQSPDIGQNSERGISDFQISGQSLIKRNCHNSRTSDDIDMRLGPVTKLDKKNKKRQKKLKMMSCHKIVTSLPFVQFTANLEQSRSWIVDA